MFIRSGNLLNCERRVGSFYALLLLLDFDGGGFLRLFSLGSLTNDVIK